MVLFIEKPGEPDSAVNLKFGHGQSLLSHHNHRNIKDYLPHNTRFLLPRSVTYRKLNHSRTGRGVA